MVTMKINVIQIKIFLRIIVVLERHVKKMNVVRINSSHGDHKAHKEVITNIRKLDRDLNTSTAILIDLQGPKLRVGEIEGGQTELVESNQLVIKVGAGEGTDKVLYTDYEQFAEDVKAGEPILCQI